MQDYLALIPLLIIGLTQALKGIITKRYIPIMALTVGAVLGSLALGFTANGVITGIISALVSMGMWSGTKTVITK
jgi:hypothetical protein